MHGFAEFAVKVALVGFDVVLTGVEAVGVDLREGWHLRFVLSATTLEEGGREFGVGSPQVIE